MDKRIPKIALGHGLGALALLVAIRSLEIICLRKN